MSKQNGLVLGISFDSEKDFPLNIERKGILTERSIANSSLNMC